MGWPPMKTPEYLGESGPFGYLEGPKELGPYLGPEGEEEFVEGETRRARGEPIEGEFRELPPEEGPLPSRGMPILEGEPTEEELEEFQGRQARGMQREAWERRQGLIGQVEKRRREALELEKLKGKTEREELKAARRRLQKQYRPPYAKIAGRVATMGGVPMTPTQRKELYFGRAKKSLYTPGAPAEALPSRESLREATKLPMEGIRKATKFPTQEESPIAGMVIPSMKGLVSVRGQSVALGMLRELSMPKGLTQVEKFALQEIIGNNDRDTEANVVRDLAAIGIPRSEAGQAIMLLLRKGLVRKTHDFKGEEPILEVVR